jgi:hypothetical protein
VQWRREAARQRIVAGWFVSVQSDRYKVPSEVCLLRLDWSLVGMRLWNDMSFNYALRMGQRSPRRRLTNFVISQRRDLQKQEYEK